MEKKIHSLCFLLVAHGVGVSILRGDSTGQDFIKRGQKICKKVTCKPNTYVRECTANGTSDECMRCPRGTEMKDSTTSRQKNFKCRRKTNCPPDTIRSVTGWRCRSIPDVMLFCVCDVAKGFCGLDPCGCEDRKKRPCPIGMELQQDCGCREPTKPTILSTLQPEISKPENYSFATRVFSPLQSTISSRQQTLQEPSTTTAATVTTEPSSQTSPVNNRDTGAGILILVIVVLAVVIGIVLLIFYLLYRIRRKNAPCTVIEGLIVSENVHIKNNDNSKNYNADFIQKGKGNTFDYNKRESESGRSIESELTISDENPEDTDEETPIKIYK